MISIIQPQDILYSTYISFQRLTLACDAYPSYVLAVYIFAYVVALCKL